jgi:queuine tRNA-ribosyltransferase
VSHSDFSFRVTHRDGLARRGELQTPHGVVPTPAFMPVGTRGAVKGITHRDLRDLGADIILGNTYHLYLKPGDGLIARSGGLHRFIGWPHPILTDSGGYQIFSLAAMRRIQEDGAQFRSHIDGSLHVLTPEGATDIQARLGSDIAMVLDECIATPAPHEVARTAMERSVRWARRARTRWTELRDSAATAALPVTNPGQAQRSCTGSWRTRRRSFPPNVRGT